MCKSILNFFTAPTRFVILVSCCSFSFFFFFIFDCYAQSYRRADTIPVYENSDTLKMPWSGGHNYVQISEIDLNGDGIKDLFVFDRTGNKISTYINKGIPNTVSYVDSSFKYAWRFPHLEGWAVLRDYNCDGKPDIFTYPMIGGGIKVYKNISTPSTGLQFVLVTPPINGVPTIQSNYGASTTNLYVSVVDIPSIEDIDGDGDLDVVTMGSNLVTFDFHINQSKELGYNCDSLIFKLSPVCFGHFTEDQNGGCSAYINTCRTTNYDSIFATKEFQTTHLMPDIARQDANDANGIAKPSLHAGNCSLCLDIDGDGDKDMITGQLSCCTLMLMTNGGTTTNVNMVYKDSTFPKYNIPVQIAAFPCGFFVDVNNDNKRDLIVCPNAAGFSIDNQSIWYYENIGTDATPIFKRVKKNLFQDEMIDVGEGADPSFFDFDSDGKTDLIVSNYYMSADSCSYSKTFDVRAYRNIGTASSPKFSLVTTDFANFSTQIPNIASKHLTFGDLDGDGDADMFVGDFMGQLHYFENTAGAGNPANFVLTTPDPFPVGGIPLDVGDYATPQLIDIDRDGDLDLIIGERSGNLNYYENIGTPTVPQFHFVSDSLGHVDTEKPCCTGYSVPFMFDSAGSYRLLVSSEASKQYNFNEGWIWYYKNIDGNLSGHFSLVDSMYKNIWEGIRMTIAGKDINNDGLMDLVIGNYCGGVAIYMGDSTNVSVHEIDTTPFDFSLYPNPTSGNIGFYNLPNSICSLTIYDLIGEKVFSDKILHHTSYVTHLDLPNGVYSCEIMTGNKRAVKKLIILK